MFSERLQHLGGLKKFSVVGTGFLTNARGRQHLDLNLTGGRDSVNRKRFLK